MKQDSEIGVALAAGHPCYFVGFLPEADARTDDRGCLPRRGDLRRGGRGAPSRRRGQAGHHRQLPGRLADHDDGGDRPELAGPIMLAGSPLSYWAGVRGKNPMRYLGGMLGGTWLTALAGDLGNGIFDGANLVANFESLNPANTYWSKAYNVYSKVDTESRALPRLRDLVGQPGPAERRGDAVDRRQPVRRQQARRPAQIRTSDGVRIDLRNITCADHRVLLVGRQHHAAAAGAGLDPRPLRPRATRSSRTARPSSTRCTRRSAISASSSPARWRPRSTASSSRAWT